MNGASQFPAQIHRVTDTGVHPLPTEGRVHVRGIPRQQNPTHPVVPRQPVFAEEPRSPPWLPHPEVVSGDSEEG